MVICCCDFLGCISQGAGWSSCAVLKAPYVPFVIVPGAGGPLGGGGGGVYWTEGFTGPRGLLDRGLLDRGFATGPKGKSQGVDCDQRPVHILLPTYPLRYVNPPDTITYILANPPDTLIYIPTALRKPTRY